VSPILINSFYNSLKKTKISISMYIVEVTPFSKSIRNDSYSYFHSKPIKVGSIVTVPLRNRNVKGLVVDCKNGKNLKSELRSSDFAIKKVKGVSKALLERNLQKMNL
jgi:primosomal protein N'